MLNNTIIRYKPAIKGFITKNADIIIRWTHNNLTNNGAWIYQKIGRTNI